VRSLNSSSILAGLMVGAMGLLVQFPQASAAEYVCPRANLSFETLGPDTSDDTSEITFSGGGPMILVLHRHQSHELAQIAESLDRDIDVAVGSGVNVADAPEVLDQDFLLHHAVSLDFQAS